MSIITTKGPIKKDKLGISLIHEHLFIDLSFTYKTPKSKEDQEYSDKKITLKNLHKLKNNPGCMKENLFLNDPDIAFDELTYYKKYGGRTLVEQSTIGSGRNVKAIAGIAEKTGINIIVSTGYYLKNTQTSEVLNFNKKTLTSNMIKELQAGIEDTNIRAGVIGELGISPDIQEWEKKLLAAGAKAQKETGVAMFIHIQAVPTVPGFSCKLNGLEVLNILEKEGADIEKVVICHTDAKTNIDYIKKIIEYGAYAEFDHIGKEFYHFENDFLMDRDYDRICALKKLIDDGCIKKILISQDVCIKTDLINYGGNGYAHILENIVPIMLKKGISQYDINNILIDNPARLLDTDSRFS